MALTDFFVPCCMQDKHTQSDGMGGVITVYEDGAMFDAGIVTDNSTEATIAYQQGLKVMYKIVTSTLVTLMQGDRVKRMTDGLVLRVTSNATDMTTPAVSEMSFRQVNAEVVNP